MTFMFNPPCSVVKKTTLRDYGFFHFIEPAPIAPTRVLKIERTTKIEPGGDYNTKVQAISEPMLTAIAGDTKVVMGMLPDTAQFLFYGSTRDQADRQRDAYKTAGLNVESFHDGVPPWQRRDFEARFRAGELQGLCTVSKVNRGFDCPSVALIVIGFGTASRSKYEQMCGRAQRVDDGKSVAWVLDYGKHGERFGSANWDYLEAIEYDRREKLRGPAEEVGAAIRINRRDPKCECTPDRFMDFNEGTVDLFDIVPTIQRAKTTGNVGVRISYVHGMGYTDQTIYPSSYAARILRILGSPEYELYGTVPHNAEEILEGLHEAVLEAGLPTHIVLRRILDTFHHKIVIAPVGFRWDGDTKDTIFDSKPAITPEFLRQRAHDRVAYANG